jgi:hypothetical protein
MDVNGRSAPPREIDVNGHGALLKEYLLRF